MGMCGSDIFAFFHNPNNNTDSDTDSDTAVTKIEKRFIINYNSIVSHSLWWIYGIYMTWVCITGEISYKRPACDIFVAGTMQFVPTMNCELSLLSLRWKDAIPLLEGLSTTAMQPTQQYEITRNVRILFYIGFILNAPLLPLYPLFVQYTNLPLGVVNAILHMNLTFAWGLQAWSLYRICLAMKSMTTTHTTGSVSDGTMMEEKKTR
jgi:hypothetical protein